MVMKVSIYVARGKDAGGNIKDIVVTVALNIAFTSLNFAIYVIVIIMVQPSLEDF